MERRPKTQMTGATPGWRHRIGAPVSIVAVAVAAVTTVALTGAFTGALQRCRSSDTGRRASHNDDFSCETSGFHFDSPPQHQS